MFPTPNHEILFRTLKFTRLILVPPQLYLYPQRELITIYSLNMPFNYLNGFQAGNVPAIYC